MNGNCCHCFTNAAGAFVVCGGCELPLHLKCTKLSNEEIEFFSVSRTPCIKLLCNRCNFTSNAVGEIKTMLNDFMTKIDTRLTNLEKSCKSAVNLHSQEMMIQEAVERSHKSCNIIMMNVPEDPCKNDVDIANDILAIVDESAVVSPDNVLRLGSVNSKSTKPRLLQIKFKTVEKSRLVLKNKHRLNQSQFKNVKIQGDKTRMQLNQLKDLRNELHQRVAAGENNITIKYINNIPQIVTSNNSLN